MEHIDRIDLTLEDRMRTIALTFRYGDNTETIRFDSKNKFQGGKLRTSFIAKCTWTCINPFFPEDWLAVKAFFTNMRKVLTATRRLLEDDRMKLEADEQGNEAYVDCTEDILEDLFFRSRSISEMTLDRVLAPAYLYYELQKTLRGFGNDKEDN